MSSSDNDNNNNNTTNSEFYFIQIFQHTEATNWKGRLYTIKESH